ncbi:MAG TPA: hypothetical protein VGI06_01175, partial [Acidimicrobiales bacterium]
RRQGEAAVAPRDRTALLSWFAIKGVVDGVPVGAHWERGVLACDGPLRDRAALVRAVDALDPAPNQPPALEAEGRHAVATLVSLIRACDEVSGVRFEVFA